MGAKIFRFTPRSHSKQATGRVLRLSPEFDGVQTLYTNDSNPGVYYNLPVVAWGLREDGEVVGMVPWLKSFVDSTEFKDPLNGNWAGYYHPKTDDIFHKAPLHKIAELNACKSAGLCARTTGIIQEIPEFHGTHVVMADHNFEHIKLVEIISWQLEGNGVVHGMITDYEKAEHLPVTFGDPALYAADLSPHFRYYFHLNLVNRIKDNDPEALSALSLLSDDFL